MNLSKAQVINLILGFFVTPMGFWNDVKYEDMPELAFFIKMGLTRTDKDDKRKIIPTKQGEEVLFSHFKEISNDFISFMCAQGMECTASKVESWFVEKYGLTDTETGADIAFLVSNNLRQFGYVCYLPRRERKEDKYIIQKIF